MFVPTPVQSPESPRVRELSREIRDLITEFQKRYPMTPREIRQALRHVEGDAVGVTQRLRVVLVAAVVAVGVAVALATRAGGTGGGGESATLPVAVLVAVLAAAAGLVAVIKRSG